ncbi:hypothetical protein Dsin_032187 [Dipteronia sinensis]|uniref:Uncharacterized protein n=1 Tax=Dipteronia sinensis TaxID=43782 RepID=A0AAD9ZMR2_9ROSI|nr:hypothetical protein Dsin_032187 [Dipteronia sinensis]
MKVEALRGKDYRPINLVTCLHKMAKVLSFRLRKFWGKPREPFANGQQIFNAWFVANENGASKVYTKLLTTMMWWGEPGMHSEFENSINGKHF